MPGKIHSERRLLVHEVLDFTLEVSFLHAQNVPLEERKQDWGHYSGSGQR